MKFWLVIQCFAVLTLAQQCETNLKPESEQPKGSICGGRGSCRFFNISRTYDGKTVSPGSYTQCAQQCFADILCKSFELVSPDKGGCTTYRLTLKQAKWEEAGPYISYDKSCFIQSGDCGIINDSFEDDIPDDTIVDDKVQTRGRFPGRDVFSSFAPWTIEVGGQVPPRLIRFLRYGNASVAVNQPGDVNNTPYGNQSLKIVSVDARPIQIVQSVTLSVVPGLNYTLSYAYNLLGYTTRKTPVKPIAHMVNALIDGEIIQSTFMNSTAGWQSASQTFVLKESPFRLGIQFLVHDPGDAVALSNYGLDNIVVS